MPAAHCLCAVAVYSNMFPENLVQACFQQIQTVYKAKKSKNATAKSLRMTTPADYDADYQYEQGGIVEFRDFEVATTAATLNLSGVADEALQRSLQYTDGINVLG